MNTIFVFWCIIYSVIEATYIGIDNFKYDTTKNVYFRFTKSVLIGIGYTLYFLFWCLAFMKVLNMPFF